MKLVPIGQIDFQQPEQTPHESKPIRAGVASVLSTPAYLQQLGGMVSAGVFTLNPFNDKTFTENLQDSDMFMSGYENVNKIHDVIGATRPEDQDKTEQVASFVGDLIPTIATFGTYGAVKVPATIASKASNVFGRKLVTKKAKQKLHTLAKEGLEQTGLDKAAKLEALKQAKIKTKDTLFHPVLAGRDLMLPGIQIPRTELLVRNNVLHGMSRDAALKAARKTQLLSGGIQAGVNVGAYEGLAALTDSEGLISDYRDEPESFELEQQMNETERSNLLPALLLGIGGFTAHKGIKKLTSNRIEDVAKDNKMIEELATETRQWSPNTDVKNSFASSASDKTTVLDNPEFNYLVDEDITGLIRSDLGTTVTKMYDTGDVGFGIANNIPFREVENNLVTLQQQAPERYELLNNYLENSHMIQSMVHDVNMSKVSPETSPDYSLFKSNDDVLADPSQTSLRDLYDTNKQLREQIKNDPQLEQVLQQISQTDKVLLDLSRKAGKYTDAEYNYLLKNRQVGDVFSYKPRIADPGSITNLQAITKNLKQYMFDSDYADELGKELGQMRTKKFDPNLKTLSYLDTYMAKVKRTLYDATTNAIKRATLPHMLRNQEEKLLTRFNDLLDLRIKQAPKGKEKAAIDKLAQEADNATRVRYLGSRQPRISPQLKAPTDVFNFLNKPKDYFNKSTAFERGYYNLQTPYKNAANITKAVESGKGLNKNTQVVSFFAEDGTQHFFEVHNLIGKMLDYSPEMLNALQNVLVKSKQTMQSFTTGNANPVFSLTSAIYSTFEGLTALPVVLSKNGLNYNMLKDSYGYIRSELKAAKMRYTNAMTQNIIDGWKRAWLLNDTNDPLLLKYTEAQIKDLELNLKNTLLSKAQRAGAVTFKYSNDVPTKMYNLSSISVMSDKFIRAVEKRFGNKSTQTLKMLGVLQECARNAGNDGMLLYIAGKKGTEDTIGLRKIADKISKNITDSKRSGNYADLYGGFLGGVARYVPYGNVMIQSISAKLHAANARAGYDFIKTATEQVKQSDKKVVDILAQLQIGAGKLKDNKFVHGLVATAGIPATICYLWNNSTDGQREQYYKLSDYDKASKYILTNFFGEGRHLSIPVDQEVSIVAKLVETMLDSVLQGSKMQDTDPAFEQHRLIMQAMSRSFNIENLVYPEVLLNASGYQSNFGPSSVSGSTSLISPIPPNQTNLDGSKTALQEGVFSQESRAIINTMFGALGNAIVGGIEQANIGTRDVGIMQGISDFASGTARPLFKSLPFLPMENKFTIRSSNQTQQSNKQKQNTIQSLRKLRSFVENDNNSEFGRRKNGKVANMADIQPLTPELQGALQIANVAVPFYNERIAPIFDQISAVYKQVAAFNATGRDRFGNIVNSGDRLSFQQRRNEQIQKLHSRIHEEFLSLEQQLTNTFGRDITLNDFDNLKGE